MTIRHRVEPHESWSVRRRCRALAWALLLLAGWAPGEALAQEGFEAFGARAGGMGGAFVSMADDASAVYWNPAGLPSVPLFDALIDVESAWVGEDDDQPITGPQPTGRRRAFGVALAVPVVGLSYVQLYTVGARLATAAGVPDRQDPGTAVVAGALRTHNIGLTLVQSVGDFLVVGTTVRLVRAEAGQTTLDADIPAGAALDAAADLEGTGHTRADADLGVMAYVGRVRLGFAVRNLGAPTYEMEGGERLEVDRAARVGVSWGSDPVRTRRAWALAVDADLTTVEALDGERRSIAAGGERWFRDGRFGVRAGARAQTVGDSRPAVTAGASATVWSGLLVDAHFLAGGAEGERGWGLSARVAF